MVLTRSQRRTFALNEEPTRSLGRTEEHAAERFEAQAAPPSPEAAQPVVLAGCVRQAILPDGTVMHFDGDFGCERLMSVERLVDGVTSVQYI